MARSSTECRPGSIPHRGLCYSAPVQAVILAGGLATRMQPLTLTTPKCMLEVAGRPFIAWQLEAIAGSGFDRVLLCVGHLSRYVRQFVGDGSHFDLRVEYVEDGPVLLGTAGALRHAVDHLEPTFLVTYGDSYLFFDYSLPLRDLDAHPDALGCMSVFENKGQWDASNTRVEGDRVVSYEKGSQDPRATFIDYGAMALRREVVAALPPGEQIGLNVVQADLAARGRLRACFASERFYEIGSAAGLEDLERRLSR